MMSPDLIRAIWTMDCHVDVLRLKIFNSARELVWGLSVHHPFRANDLVGTSVVLAVEVGVTIARAGRENSWKSAALNRTGARIRMRTQSKSFFHGIPQSLEAA